MDTRSMSKRYLSKKYRSAMVDDPPDRILSRSSGSRSTVTIFSPPYSSASRLPRQSRTLMPPPKRTPPQSP